MQSRTHGDTTNRIVAALRVVLVGIGNALVIRANIDQRYGHGPRNRRGRAWLDMNSLYYGLNSGGDAAGERWRSEHAK